MKHLISVVMVFIHLSCNTIDKEPMKDMVDSSIENAGQTSDPGGITFNAKVLEIYNSGKDICGTSFTYVLKLEITKIIQNGSSITHMPHKGNKILVNLALKPSGLTIDKTIEVKARESLCREVSKSYFTVISYKNID